MTRLIKIIFASIFSIFALTTVYAVAPLVALGIIWVAIKITAVVVVGAVAIYSFFKLTSSVGAISDRIFNDNILASSLLSVNDGLSTISVFLNVVFLIVGIIFAIIIYFVLQYIFLKILGWFRKHIFPFIYYLPLVKETFDEVMQIFGIPVPLIHFANEQVREARHELDYRIKQWRKGMKEDSTSVKKEDKKSDVVVNIEPDKPVVNDDATFESRLNRDIERIKQKDQSSWTPEDRLKMRLYNERTVQKVKEEEKWSD